MGDGPSRSGWRDAGIAWLIYLLPRVVTVWLAWPSVRIDTSSTAVVDGVLLTDLRTPLWPPFYDAFAEVMWRLSMGRPAWYIAAHIAMQATLGVSVSVIGRAMGLTSRATWGAVIACALLPYFVATSLRQIDVGVVIAMAAWFTAVVVAWRSTRRHRLVLDAAVAFAALLLFLTRADAALMVAGVYAAVWWWPGALPRGRVLMSAGILALLLIGWTGVNAWRFGVITPLPAHGGYHFWVGNHPGVAADLSDRRFNPTNVAPPPGDAVDASYASSDSSRRAAWAFIRQHPADAALALVPKTLRYWDAQLDEQTAHSFGQRVAYSVPYVIYLPLAILGAIVLWRRRLWFPLALLVAVIVGYWLPHLALYGLIRHRMTVEWALLILAAVAADALLPATRAAYSLRRDE